MQNFGAAPRSEYLPHEAEAHHQNGNGSHNGNGTGKVFRLAPAVTPEEEARTEVLREIAPRIRRKVREDSRLSAGAKFFFYALFDDCFWHAVGGHGTGQIFADIRTLAERYGHDEKSIIRWREELEEAGWLWTNYQWPMTEWRLTPLMPAPAFSPHKKAVQMSLGRAAKPVGETPTTPRTGGKSAKNGGTPGGRGQNGHSPTPSFPTPVGETPVERGHFGGDSVGGTPTGEGHNAHGLPPEIPRAKGGTPTSDGQDAHDQTESHPRPHAKSSRPLGQNGSGEKTPGEGSNGERNVCEAKPTHPPIPRFEELDRKMAPRLRPQYGDKAIELCKEKIFAQENKRPPAANAKEVIAAYKARIREIKKWQAGEL